MVPYKVIPNRGEFILAFKVDSFDKCSQHVIRDFLIRSEEVILSLSKMKKDADFVFHDSARGKIEGWKGYLDFSFPNAVLVHGKFDDPERVASILAKMISNFSELAIPTNLANRNPLAVLIDTSMWGNEDDKDDIKMILEHVRDYCRIDDYRIMAKNLLIRL